MSVSKLKNSESLIKVDRFEISSLKAKNRTRSKEG